MVKTVTTTSESGFVSTNEIREYEMTIDGGGEEAPDTLESLLGTYASCYIVALRVAGKQRGVDELGTVEIETTGELNDDDKLAATRFEIGVEADVDEETAAQIIERANELCKVHDALKGEVRAESTLTGNAI